MPDTYLANTVTSFATILSGVLTILLTFIRPQPRRWLMVYGAILLTGLPTLWMHGTAEANFTARLADIGTNLLLAWSIQFAVLGDFYSKKTRLLVTGATAVLIITYMIWSASVGPVRSRVFPIDLGDFGGFTVGELMLISNSLLATGLLAGMWKRLARYDRPLLVLLIVWFIGGMILASGSNQRVDWGFFAWHALWHIESAFGFFILWALNDSRFHHNWPASKV